MRFSLDKIEVLHRFMALSFADKKLFLEAYGMLAMMRAAILIIPFKKLTKGLKHTSSAPVLEPLNTKESEMAHKIAKAISQAAAHTPWESACLAQSLTAKRMLRRQRIHGLLYLGVTKDSEDIKAHSWTQCGDVIVTGEVGCKAFRIISVFEWENE